MDSLTSPIEFRASFPRLPPEIIVAIVSELVLIHDKNIFRDKTFEQLKILRLTHRKFADCAYVNKLLFTRIQLESTRGSLQRGDFSRVVGYTKSIRFAAYPSWKLVSETYERIVHFDSLHEWDPDASILSREDLVQAHDAYIRDAKEAQRLLEDPDGDLIETWTNALKMVGSRLEKVTLSTNTDWKNLHPQDPDTTIEPHEMMQGLGRYKGNSSNVNDACYNALAIVGERLFITAMTCLSASGIAISSLLIDLYMLGNVECADIPGWRQLDLSKLKKLELTTLYPGKPLLFPLSKESAMAAFLYKKKREIHKKIGDMAHDLIDKCHSTVEELELADNFMEGGSTMSGSMVWPTRPATYDFPALQKFSQRIDINPHLLHDWLLKMKNLRSLNIDGELAGRRAVKWRHVFDAIRDHPNVSGPDPKGLRFRFPLETDYDGVVCKDSSIATPREEPDAYDSAYPLEAHLYGEIEFSRNEALIFELGGSGAVDQGSDEGEDHDMEGDNESEDEEQSDREE